MEDGIEGYLVYYLKSDYPFCASNGFLDDHLDDEYYKVKTVIVVHDELEKVLSIVMVVNAESINYF